MSLSLFTQKTKHFQTDFKIFSFIRHYTNTSQAVETRVVYLQTCRLANRQTDNTTFKQAIYIFLLFCPTQTLHFSSSNSAVFKLTLMDSCQVITLYMLKKNKEWQKEDEAALARSQPRPIYICLDYMSQFMSSNLIPGVIYKLYATLNCSHLSAAAHTNLHSCLCEYWISCNMQCLLQCRLL